jgi:hypothetical protein
VATVWRQPRRLSVDVVSGTGMAIEMALAERKGEWR